MASRPPRRALLRLRQRVLACQQEAPLQVPAPGGREGARPRSVGCSLLRGGCQAGCLSQTAHAPKGRGALEEQSGSCSSVPVRAEYVFKKPDLESAPAQPKQTLPVLLRLGWEAAGCSAFGESANNKNHSHLSIQEFNTANTGIASSSHCWLPSCSFPALTILPFSLNGSWRRI